MNLIDIFNDDAFSVTSLTAAINNMDHVPGRAGTLVFAGVGEGVNTLSVAVEMKGETLSLIQTSPRGAPAPKEKQDKGTLRNVSIPQIKLEDTVGAAQVVGVREFGSTDQLRGVQTVINTQLAKMTRRHDLTIEHHRLGALKGVIKDADSSTLTDLFSLFSITNDNQSVGGGAAEVGPKTFNLDLMGEASEPTDLRVKCQEIVRFIYRNAKTVIPAGAQVWAFCGDSFFDSLVSLEDVKRTFLQTEEQKARLGGNYAFGVFEFGGIVWENYRGTDDNSTVAIGDDECRFFLTGVPGLYAEYFAPADFMDTVNTIGLPRYARQAVDTRFQQYVELHTQQNPLPLCLRPKTLCKGVASI